MAHTKTKLEIFTYAKNTNFRANALAATKVIEKCIQLTGNNNIEHHIRYENVFDKSLFFQRPIEYSDNNKISYVYTAVTANPPINIADSFLGKDSNDIHEKRDPEINHNVFDGNWIRPFCNVNKQKISEMYDILKIKESIFPLTFSCENVNAADVYQHCDNCWWCKERQWGFNI
jgi:hypothetical protein